MTERGSADRLRMALDASGRIGTWEWDLATDVITGDERTARLYGVDPPLAAEGAPPASFLVHVHPDDHGPVSDQFIAAIASGASLETECRLRMPDGEQRWISVQGRCRHGPDGRPTLFAGVTFDITATKRAEADLRQEKEEREFILSLVERQRLLQDPDDLMRMTAEAIGLRLGVDRAGFFEVVDDTIIRFGPCWTGGKLAPLTGDMPSTTFGDAVGRVIRSGGTLVFSGDEGDEVVPASNGLAATGTRAGISVPLVRHGRWEGAFYLGQADSRRWSEGEIALVEEAAQLAWDAVERARAATQLRKRNRRLVGEVAERTAERDRVWEVSHDLLGVADPDGTWRSVNPAWTRTLGWEAHELIGKTSEWLLHPDELATRRERLATLRRGDEISRYELRMRTRDGEYRYLSWTATLAERRLYAIARDVTEERRQQAALRAAEQRTQLVLGAMDGVGIWSYDIANDRFQSDAGFAALYGFTPEQAESGASMAELLGRVHPEDIERLMGVFAEMRDQVGGGEVEYRVVRPDQSQRWVMVRNHALLNDKAELESVVGVGIDVTRLRELEESLRQAQKMEAVGQLTGGLAHDFNNLLTGISGALEMMQLRLKQGRIDALPRYIGAAQTAAGRAAALTHRLLAFARRQPLDPRPSDVGRLIAGMEDLLRGTVGPGVDLRVLHAADSWAVQVDANQLENALLNLCINARDAMPEGGVLTVETANVWLDEAGAAERDLSPGAYLTLCVSDTGIGMPPEVAARAFEPFFTTKPKEQGTGLGLSMIYGFARQSGGQIHIRSAPGAGTTMSLYLPRHVGTVVTPGEGGRRATIRQVATDDVVLVVEDEPGVRMLVTDLLDELGYGAIEAGDGAEGVAALRSDARIDLLITDVGLPGGMNGRQVADIARELRPGLPVLFITGFAENAVVGDGPLEEGMELLAKPFTIDALAARITRLVGAR
ncbi:PAS domain-containing protein [Sphingomonas sp. AR_OL41]|uniref:PAS domain-containing protein n=1 Tax=Sphingomonas sp. AR_OL41 TaxID=3042729 RepID=UPI002480BFB0|nr:PAS domain-containing protein [Sphingomonas sp. AR_OL41]MDH7974829.1 PAS domain-containing protein [Sphingomonas sp. AR_OL41]